MRSGAIDDAAPVTERLVRETIRMGARSGIGNISLRNISSSAGCSTSVIFQHYGDKAGLVGAALKHAIVEERDIHVTMYADINGLLVDRLTFADFVASYIEGRSTRDAPLFVSGLVLHDEFGSRFVASLREWHGLRTEFWAACLAQYADAALSSELLTAYVAMEEFYAFALGGSGRYRLLLRETTRALTGKALGDVTHDAMRRTLAMALNAVPRPLGESAASNCDSVPERLLKNAANAMIAHGVHALNQRDVARSAKVSPSMIAYHFGDMDSFADKAIWRALLHNVPQQLNPELQIEGRPITMAEWLEALDRMLQPGNGAVTRGFYAGFAGITAQACLLAQSRPELRPLIAYLRELEGWGTYRVSRNVAGSPLKVGRDHAAAFAVWLKAQGMLTQAGIVTEPITVAMIENGAEAIFPVGS